MRSSWLLQTYDHRKYVLCRIFEGWIRCLLRKRTILYKNIYLFDKCFDLFFNRIKQYLNVVLMWFELLIAIILICNCCNSNILLFYFIKKLINHNVTLFLGWQWWSSPCEEHVWIYGSNRYSWIVTIYNYIYLNSFYFVIIDNYYFVILM